MHQPSASNAFLGEVIDSTPGGDALITCLQCGTCGGSCPSGADMEHTPRAVFAMIQAGLRDEVLRSNTPWYCVACYYCMVRCPKDIPITDLMYSLKRLAVRERLYDDRDAPDWSQSFIGMVDSYGRSFEFGLATRYHLTHKPLKKVSAGPLVIEMFRRDRMALRPDRIRGLDQLRAILEAARAQEAM